MFSDKILGSAGHCIFASKVASELESRGGSMGCGTEIYGAVERLAVDPVVGPTLAKIESKLGASVEAIFQAGGIEQDEATLADALGDLLLSVSGEGTGIEDKYGWQWKAGLAALGIKGELPHDEMDAYYEIAANWLDESGYENPEDDTLEPIIKLAFDWHGGQNSMVYAFASTAMIQHENHRKGTLAELRRALNTAKRDVAPGLRRLIKAVKAAKIGQKFFYI